MHFDDKVVLITGAGSGIGAATARRFARAGAAVLVFDRDEAAAQSVAKAIAADGGRANAYFGDAANAADAERVVAAAVADFGGLDVLVNNVGIGLRGSVVSMSETDWDRLWSVNVKSGFLMSKYAVPRLRARGGGSILFTASMGAIATSTGMLAYCASKAAIVSMTRTMALDHGPHGIRVNCVCPGPTRTPTFSAQIAAAGITEAVFESAIPLGRIATPGDVAAAFVWLASPEASFVNGQALQLDGGQFGGMYLKHLVEP